MPELPEVEVVRAGLCPAVTGATITEVEVFDGRSLNRHISSAETRRGEKTAGHGKTLTPAEQQMRGDDFVARLTGLKLETPARRGKFLWIPFANNNEALLAHLGMSGQLLLRRPDAPDDKHVRIRIWLEHSAHGMLRLDFADQRRFGSLAIDQLVATGDNLPAGWGTAAALLPSQAAHIARDLLDEACDIHTVATKLVTKPTAIKKLLLDQSLVSGIGNIYADEALWASSIHPETPAVYLSAEDVVDLLYAARDVMLKALAAGGTSFDAQYVNTDGEAGYFARDLNAYGRVAKPCYRCQTPLTSNRAVGRASYFCPRCQKLPVKTGVKRLMPAR